LRSVAAPRARAIVAARAVEALRTRARLARAPGATRATHLDAAAIAARAGRARSARALSVARPPRGPLTRARARARLRPTIAARLRLRLPWAARPGTAARAVGAPRAVRLAHARLRSAVAAGLRLCCAGGARTLAATRRERSPGAVHLARSRARPAVAARLVLRLARHARAAARAHSVGPSTVGRARVRARAACSAGHHPAHSRRALDLCVGPAHPAARGEPRAALAAACDAQLAARARAALADAPAPVALSAAHPWTRRDARVCARFGHRASVERWRNERPRPHRRRRDQRRDARAVVSAGLVVLFADRLSRAGLDDAAAGVGLRARRAQHYAKVSVLVRDEAKPQVPSQHQPVALGLDAHGHRAVARAALPRDQRKRRSASVAQIPRDHVDRRLCSRGRHRCKRAIALARVHPKRKRSVARHVRLDDDLHQRRRHDAPRRRADRKQRERHQHCAGRGTQNDEPVYSKPAPPPNLSPSRSLFARSAPRCATLFLRGAGCSRHPV
jgi:hypothetical protein